MKVLVLLSGGVDSSTCLALAKEKYGDNVLALSMSYGQKHAKELAAAQAIADYYHVELLHMDLSKIFAHSKCSLLQGSDESVPHASYAEQLKESKGEPVSTYVPFRNGLFCRLRQALPWNMNAMRFTTVPMPMMLQAMLIPIAVLNLMSR